MNVIDAPAFLGGPVAVLQVGDEHDAARTVDRVELVAGEAQHLGEVVGAVGELQLALDPVARARRRGAFDEGRGPAAGEVVARHDDRHFAAVGQILKERARALADARQGAASGGARVGRKRGVEHQHDAAHGTAQRRERRRAHGGSRQREREQRDHGDAQQEQNQVLHLHAPLLLAQRGEQELHRRPFHDAVAAAEEQMDDDRDRREAGAQPEKSRMGEGDHSASHCSGNHS